MKRELKQCKKCGRWDGSPTDYCGPCKKIMVAEYKAAHPDVKNPYLYVWRLINPEKYKALQAKFYKDHREKIRADYAKWAAENKEKLRLGQARYRAENPEKIRARNKAWYDANPEAARLLQQNRRARRMASGGVLSKGLADKLFKLQKGKCACCKKPLGDDYHLDHIMPLALGGSNTDDNIQLLRGVCNNKKWAKHPIDFMQEKGFLL